MTDAQLLLRLERTARYWLRRYSHLAGALDAAELVSEGWLAWSRRGNWTRAQGAMRDRLRAAHRDRMRHAELDDSRVRCRERGRVLVQVPATAPFERLPLLFVEHPSAWARSRQGLRPSERFARHDFDRDRQILRLAAQGCAWTEIGPRVGVGAVQAAQLHARALRRLEAARIAQRLGRGRELTRAAG